MYKHVLVPLDGSELAEVALAPAIQLARQSSARLTLLRVVPEVKSYLVLDLMDLDWDAMRAALKHDAAHYLAAVRERLAGEGLDVQAETRTGDAASTIVDAAHALSADVIVMGTHGRSGPARWALGSVADRVVGHARTPVLLLRAETAAAA